MTYQVGCYLFYTKIMFLAFNSYLDKCRRHPNDDGWHPSPWTICSNRMRRVQQGSQSGFRIRFPGN